MTPFAELVTGVAGVALFVAAYLVVARFARALDEEQGGP